MILEGKILTIVIASVCALIGGIILLVGFIRKNRWLKTIGGAFTLMGIVSLFVNDEDFRAIMIGAAAVIVAAAAALALQQNTRLRQDAKEREQRDRTEKRLKEVIDWATDVSTRKSPVEVLSPELMLDKMRDPEEIIRFIQIYGNADLLSQYAVLMRRSKYISLIASALANDLGKAVDDVCGKIDHHGAVLLEGMKHTAKIDEYETILFDISIKGKSELRDGLSEDAKALLAIFDDRKDLDESAGRVIDLAVGLLTSLSLHMGTPLDKSPK